MSQAMAPVPDGFNAVLKHAAPTCPARARACPFLKWAGGKRAIVPDIVKRLPGQFGHYWEPFCGGAAVFFALDSWIRTATLSDVNQDLMLTYRMLKKDKRGVIRELAEHARRHSRAHYLRVRAEGHGCREPVKIAARFIYLNRTCYNGLYRVNRAGEFNVPIGSYRNPKICDAENLMAVADVLNKATLRSCSFEKIRPRAGDLVYCDPPYDGAYANYTGQGFTSRDQQALRDACLGWQEAGAHVIISNSDTPFIRSLYQSFSCIPVAAPRSINSQGKGRGMVQELLLCGSRHVKAGWNTGAHGRPTP